MVFPNQGGSFCSRERERQAGNTERGIKAGQPVPRIAQARILFLKLDNQLQVLLRQVMEVKNAEGEEKVAAQKELLNMSKAIGETIVKIAQLSEHLKGKEWLDPLEQAELIAENEMMKAAESIEQAAKRLADIKKKKSEEMQQVEILLIPSN